MTRTSPENLTDQLIGDLSRAIRIGGPVLTTLRKQGYIISAKELDVLKPDWRKSKAWQSTTHPKRQLPAQMNATAPGPTEPSPARFSLELEPVRAATGDQEIKPQNTGAPSTDDIGWLADGACKGADWADFNPLTGGMTPEAEDACGGCGVRQQCLDFALANPGKATGIWGGVSENDRDGRTTDSRLHGLFEFEPGIYICLQKRPQDPYSQINQGLIDLIDAQMMRPLDIRSFLESMPPDAAGHAA